MILIDENNRLRERAERAERILGRMQAARSELRDAHAHFAYVVMAGKSVDRAENGRGGRSPWDDLNAAIRAMVLAGMDAEPAADPAVAGLVAAFGLPGEAAAIDPETLDCPQFGASEGDPPRQDAPGRAETASDVPSIRPLGGNATTGRTDDSG